MKKIWTVKTSAFNGTVTMFTEVSNYLDENLAKTVADTIDKANSGGTFPTYSTIEETTIYEDAKEVPILEETKYEKKTYSEVETRILELEREIKTLKSTLYGKERLLSTLIEKRDTKTSDLEGKYYKVRDSSQYLKLDTVDSFRDNVLSFKGTLYCKGYTAMTVTKSYTSGNCLLVLSKREDLVEISKEDFEKFIGEYGRN